jgi:hypothetical protein
MIAEIAARRRATVAQALDALELAAASDPETRRSLLAIAGRALGDPRVAQKWIDLAGAEADASLRRAMIAALRGNPIPDLAGYVSLLTSSLDLDPVRSTAVEALGRILVHAPQAVDALIETFRRTRRAGVRRSILTALLRFDDPSPKILDFLAEIAPELPTGDPRPQTQELQQEIRRIVTSDRPPQEKADSIAKIQREFQERLQIDDTPLKLAVVDRLLRMDRFDRRWLEPVEAPIIRRRALSHLADRPATDVDVAPVLARDPDVECRLWAVQILAASGRSEPLLEAARRDRDPRVRKAALAGLESIELTPAVLETLRTESSAEIVDLILSRWAALASRSERVRDALWSLLGPDLKAGIAKSIYEILGRVLTRDLFEAFLKSYETATEDRIRAAILQALSTWHEPDERLARLYVAALASARREIREWGARGLTLLPLTEENVASIEAGAGALLDIDPSTAVRLAEKIAKIPRLSADVRAALKRVADSPEDDDLRRICRGALDRSASEIDWDQWLRRVGVEHNLEGVFPQIYSVYDSNPRAARQILRTALLDPGCRTHDVAPGPILQFLVARDGMDDDLCRFCLDHAGAFLHYLKLRPEFPELKERIWEAMAKEVNPVMLRELLVMIFGSDQAAGEAVRARFARLHSAPGARPWIRFLQANILWPPAESILRERPELLDAESRRALGDPPPERGPGLADE